ncbi:MAG: glycerophosphoryl diester phosphodiesterase membrane domain-containing protein [Bacteroidota bacterium]
MEPKIELAKLRDFGEIISDTFQFIRQNFKEILKSFFIFCGFFLVALAAVSFLQQYKIMHIFNEATSGGPRTFSTTMSDFWVSYVATTVLSFLTMCAISVTVLSFMALYKQKGNVAPTTDEVWGYFKYYYLRVLGGTFVLGILIGAGFVLCLIPGIYLFPILGLVLPIMVMENTAFGYAFNRSFQLIKQNWWATAGAVLVIWIIVYVMMIVITIPASAVNVASILLRPQKLPQLSMGSILLGVILQAFAQILFIIPTIGIALCYFNLAEHKEGTSLLDRINKFGTPGEQTNLPTEEY